VIAFRPHRILPYVIVLAITAYLYILAGRIDFAAPGGRIGPNFWPKLILALAALTCLYEIAKNLLFEKKGEDDLEGVLAIVIKDTPDAEGDDEDMPERSYPVLLWGGIALTIAYVVLIETLGFFLCTAIFLGLFMWLGRYRRRGVIVVTALLGSLIFLFMFMKVVYVSLPLGTGPFAQVSFLLMRLMGIK